MMKNGFFSRESLHGLCRSVVLIALLASGSFALERVVGANATFDMEAGARSAALGSATMAIDGDYLGLLSNPYQLARARYSWVNFSHTEYYEDTKYDFTSAVIPFGDSQGLGVAFARFGADDIPWIKEGEPIPEGERYNTMSIADWVLSVSWGRRLTDRLDLGVSFHGIYRDMDQTGFGFRSDVGVRYNALENLYLSALLKGWTSSAARWESGEVEYSSPEIFMAASYGIPISYLYGALGLYWQSSGLLHQESRAMEFGDAEDTDGRFWESPLDWLSGGHGGLEFNFDFGLSLRAGLASFTTWRSFTAGAGLVIAHFIKVDYAFENHPVLTPIHRVSVSVSPYLFSHAPTPEKSHLTPAKAAQKPLGEEPDEQDIENQTSEEPKPGTPVESVEKSPEEPALKPQDEPQETVPAGGTYWEE